MFENLKILVVDDDKMMRKFLVLQLMMIGFKKENTIDANDPFEAIEILKSFTPNIIITDYTMPGMNGIQFVKRVKGNPELASVPIIFYTGNGSIEYLCAKENIEALFLSLAPKDKELINIINQAITK